MFDHSDPVGTGVLSARGALGNYRQIVDAFFEFASNVPNTHFVRMERLPASADREPIVWPAFPISTGSTLNEIAIRDRRIAEHANNAGGIRFTLRLLERYRGVVDQKVTLDAAMSPVLADWASRNEWSFDAEFLDFDSDCQCGTVWGTLGE